MFARIKSSRRNRGEMSMSGGYNHRVHVTGAQYVFPFGAPLSAYFGGQRRSSFRERIGDPSNPTRFVGLSGNSSDSPHATCPDYANPE
jgi:hypothetical protein